jgi:hypothetical protein
MLDKFNYVLVLENVTTKFKMSRLGHGCLFLVSIACCKVEVSATGRSLVQRSSTDSGVYK